MKRAADRSGRVTVAGAVTKLAAPFSSQIRPPAAPVLHVRLGAGIRAGQAELTPALASALRHAASMHNPQFYERQRMRASTYNSPRFLYSFDETIDGGLILPRGMLGTHVEDHPDPLDIEVLETQIRREASAAMGLGAEVDLAIFVRYGGRMVPASAGGPGATAATCKASGWSLACGAAASGRSSSPLGEAEAAARGCARTVHFTYAFQARALYERNGYELVGRVGDFPSGTDVLWYRKLLNPSNSRRARNGPGPRSPARTPPPS